MSLHVLDTDILSLYQHEHSVVKRRVEEYVQRGELAITVISVEEQLRGWYTLVRQARGPAERADA
jgi:tRNA(fMet)-specific endonuclease VapC